MPRTPTGGWYETPGPRTELPVRAGCQCCQDLSDRVMELEDIASSNSAGLRRVREHFKLTVREAAILMAMVRFNRSLAKDELMTLAYPVEHDRPELKIIDVFICKMRKKLPKELCPITDWGQGYRLDSAARRALQAIASGAGEQSDGVEDQVIDFARVRAATFNRPGVAPVPAINFLPLVIPPEAQAIARQVFDEGRYAEKFAEAFDTPAPPAEVERIRRHATDILGGLAG